MIKAVIIDDEQHCIDRLCNLLPEIKNPVIQLSGTAQTVDEGISLISKHHPQLVFLDVQIADKTGFDLLKAIPDAQFQVIFTTAHDRYALQAFRFCALDYLLKPVDADELQAALLKVNASKNNSVISEQISELLKGVGTKPRKIGVPTLNGIVFVPVSEIIRCHADGNYTELHLAGKKQMVVSKTLKEFENLLADYSFFRVHHSDLVNLDYVKSYNKGKGGYLMLDDNSSVEVSSRRKEELLKKLGSM
ncbi:MAG: Sensory transduction protein LytR [Bacteroidetes bacterium ADurb.Bin141]|nr:MAG: LytTR family two component transcriptional regulator [Bacteroidetes bacterium OLB10]MBV6453248.1 Sensory transduction protein LytR [Bacteroidia bacterium]MBX3105357.1 response regulator transcription factor [Bacteroidota bacterium]OQB62931.1 MAG: Sensory transduction protein LytR [Bacteroidetes bacterium ADurb.Bin141]MCB8930892.1 response regulator transcription factor [Bacteroidia bacterium]